MKTYPLSALLGRMKYITRWSLMRNGRPETLSEHTADTALLAHMLCLIAQNCTGTGAGLRPEVVATAALYHDAPEILTGDMPTPVKYKNDALRSAYKAVERESARVMASLLPAELRPQTEAYLTGAVLNDAERKVLKAADRLSAIIKCIEESQGGNREFEAAKEQQLAALHALDCPEAEYFIQHMLPCYAQNLDELTRGRF
ncbi:5'-deoxynucleotidase [uncultured Subdoligranulum sp.]|uniref:5'-deoxynucleotidase n=1 Tax=Candidatus Gemmiger excrementavium TaxID=2838608 RepID=A0A9D2JG96_9FIRM|nr:5'-deoxynucleotidase [uncultured Subdoligranulum sp.]HIZ47574.1 5'-deoxynucleotidase [Candidatus Gemmiger excrementavium]